jgi:hypothetical protein
MTAATPDGTAWGALIDDVRSGPGTDARHQVGAWAMGLVRSALGEDWPRRWHERHGHLPAFVLDPATSASAYAQLVETWLRLHSLAGTLRLGRLTREWSRHLEPIQMRHTSMQLEVAALARSLGAGVEFETPTALPATSRPADAVISAQGTQLIAECFCVYSDQDTSQAMAYDSSIGRRLNMIGLDVRLSGHYDVRLPPDETEELLVQVQQAAAGVLADGVPRDVIRPGIEFRLAPWSDPDGTEVMLEGPSTPGAEWRRARGIINGKAQDWTGSPLPAWLRFDLLDGTWLFSNWARRPLPDKTEWMAALLADAVAGTDVAGVVASCGSRLDPSAQDESYVGTGGIVGLRRRLDPLRVRETIIVPLSEAGAGHKQLWASLYDAEPGWIPGALRSAALPGLEDIERGWSLPA